MEGWWEPVSLADINKDLYVLCELENLKINYNAQITFNL